MRGCELAFVCLRALAQDQFSQNLPQFGLYNWTGFVNTAQYSAGLLVSGKSYGCFPSRKVCWITPESHLHGLKRSAERSFSGHGRAVVPYGVWLHEIVINSVCPSYTPFPVDTSHFFCT